MMRWVKRLRKTRTTKPELKGRVQSYKNLLGERVAVNAIRSTDGVRAKVYLFPEKDRTKLFAEATLLISKKEKTITITELYNKQTTIEYAIEEGLPPRVRKKHRGIIDIVVDECKKLGQTEFQRETWTILITPNDAGLQRHYLKKGFKKILGEPFKLQMQIASKK